MDKKLIALVVLGIAAGISLIYGITSPGKGRGPALRISAISQKTGSAQKIAGIMPNKRRAKRTSFTSWERSPFVPAGSGVASSNLDLKGIMWNEKKPRAMIGTAIVGKGDRVGNNTVVEVKKDRVILNDGTKDFEMKLRE